MYSKKLQLDSVTLNECQCGEEKFLQWKFLRAFCRRSSWLMRFVAKLWDSQQGLCPGEFGKRSNIVRKLGWKGQQARLAL